MQSYIYNNKMETKEKTKRPKRVAITGIGLASSIGINYSDFSENIFSGKHGFIESTIEEKLMGAPKYISKINKKVIEEIANYLNISSDKVIHNFSCSKADGYIKKAELLFLWSCLTAFENSKLSTTNFKSYDGGLFLGIDSQMDDFFHYYNYLKNKNCIDINIELSLIHI